MWRLAVLVAGCGFHPTIATSDDSGSEPPAEAGATSCAITTAGTGTPTQSLGGSGGTARPDLACAATEMPIGISVATTSNTRPEGGPGGERVVTSLDVLCGITTQTANGKLERSTRESIGWTANQCAGWPPYTTTPVVLCPDNTILVGLTGNGGPTTLFNTVSLLCALVDGDTVGSLVAPQPVADSGAYSNHLENAKCPDGQIVVGFEDRGDCGVDGVAPICAPMDCR